MNESGWDIYRNPKSNINHNQRKGKRTRKNFESRDVCFSCIDSYVVSAQRVPSYHNILHAIHSIGANSTEEGVPSTQSILTTKDFTPQMQYGETKTIGLNLCFILHKCWKLPPYATVLTLCCICDNLICTEIKSSSIYSLLYRMRGDRLL